MNEKVMSVSTDEKRQEGGFAETLRVIGQALIIALVIRTFLFQAFNIPSGSMEGTLLVGDYLFVSTYSYGYTHYTLPFSPKLFSGRVFGSEPKRGDVVVFRLPRDDSIDYIKRVIGLPGDRIQMIDGLLHINGVAVKRERAEDYIDNDEGPEPIRVKRWRETLPNGVSYETLDRIEHAEYDDTQPYVVPPGHFFMMGDNRDNSARERRGRLCAIREHYRSSPNHLFLGRRPRASLASVALAGVAALESPVHDRAVSELYRSKRAEGRRVARPLPCAAAPSGTRRPGQLRPEERALARVSKDGHNRGRASGHPSRRAPKRRAPLDEVRRV
jgi:signal peptidase I